MALAFQGVSPLYQGFFANPPWVTALGKDLGSCFDGTVEVVISYDMETRIGRIVTQTGLNELGCRPVAHEDGLDITPLAPLGKALANYRDIVTAERDVRIGSFRAGLRMVQRGEICDLYIGGQFPPDGTTFSPCIALRGNEVCLGDRHEPLTRIPWPEGEDREILERCFGL